jgi:hypothetical protein
MKVRSTGDHLVYFGILFLGTSTEMVRRGKVRISEFSKRKEGNREGYGHEYSLVMSWQ